SCQPCLKGTFVSGTGAAQCSPCPGLHFAHVFMVVNALIVIAVGQFGNSSAMTFCYDCPPATFQSTPGSISCQLCPAGKAFAGSKAAQCSDCQPGTVLLAHWSVLISNRCSFRQIFCITRCHSVRQLSRCDISRLLGVH